MTGETRSRITPTDDTHRVTTLELFFDLVFVFAITQVTQFLADDLSLRGVFRGILLLATLWFVWASYSWLGNQARADEGVVRLGMVLAMGAVFVAALCIPEAWSDKPGGLDVPLVLAICIALVRLGHLGIYWIASDGDKGLQRQLKLTLAPVFLAVSLLVLGGALGGWKQSACWIAALCVDWIGIYAVGAEGWRLHSAVHFAERHGLIVLIALGESLIAVGVGVQSGAVTAAVVVASLLALAVTLSMWWSYFDVVALVAERVLGSKTGSDRSRMARDSYTYLHFPMVAGIIFTALGFKKVLEYVADTGHHTLSDPLPGTPLSALYGGVAVYLAAHVAFRLRNVRTWNRQRTFAAIVIIALIPVAAQIPALAALGLLAAVLCSVTTYEVIRFSKPRDEIRHAPGHG